jgi:TrmH family RNA methyltransferase
MRDVRLVGRESQLENLCVVLVAPRNPLNIGAVARAMSNFGVETLRVVNPYEVAFRDARSAVGAEDLLSRAELFGSVAEAVADCVLVVGTTAAGRREPLHPMHRLAEAAGLVRTALMAGRVVLMFGSEKRGLLNEDLAYCHWVLNIPTAERQPSMNLGQAAAVCLYELARVSSADSGEKSAKGAQIVDKSEQTAATGVELERLTNILLETLDASGYTLPDKAALTEQNVRRLIRRVNPDRDDAELLLGMLRQMLWKLRSAERF